MIIHSPEEKLGAYNGEHLIAILSPGKTLADYTWISVWCRQAGVSVTNFLYWLGLPASSLSVPGFLRSDASTHTYLYQPVCLMCTFIKITAQ